MYYNYTFIILLYIHKISSNNNNNNNINVIGKVIKKYSIFYIVIYALKQTFISISDVQNIKIYLIY